MGNSIDADESVCVWFSLVLWTVAGVQELVLQVSLIFRVSLAEGPTTIREAREEGREKLVGYDSRSS